MPDIESKTPEGASSSERPSRQGGFWRSLYEIFTDPAKVFSRIDGGLSWWKPFIVMSAVSMVLGFVMNPYRRAALLPTLQKLPPEQMEKALENMDRFGTVGLIMVPIVLIVMYVIIAGITHVAINIASSRANFAKTLSLLFFCGLVPLLEQIIVTVAIAARGMESVESFEDLKMSLGPAALLPDAAGALRAFLESLSLFQIWYYIILVLGVASIFRISRKIALVCILPVWLISFLMLLLGSKFQAGFGG